jgi:hypothetical protein
MNQAEHERWWRECGSRELRELLFFEWDPIGLSRLADSPLDEYDHYAGTIVRRLRAGSSLDELAAVLDDFRRDMGLDAADEPPADAAAKIADWYRRSTAEWAAG